MISIQNFFLFIHVPKTGGNSVQNILRDYSEDNIVLVASHQDGKERFEIRNDKYGISKHSSLSEYKKMIEPEVFKKLFKFSIIRNPWDRMISYYFSPSRKVTEWKRDEFIKLVHRVNPAEEYLQLKSFAEKVNKKLNCGLFPTKGKPLGAHIDYIIKFEKINEGFKNVCEQIGIPYEKLPHRNLSVRRHYSYYYDSELIAMVNDKFRDEVEFGNYNFEKK